VVNIAANAKEERERQERERQERERQERERQERERQERERQERERQERERQERERQERERQERERQERERQERERQEKERQERERQERERQEKERQARERQEREQLEKMQEQIWKVPISEISKRLFSFLSQDQINNANEGEIIQRMTDGSIPMGFPSHSLWSRAHDTLCKLPESMREKEQKLAAAQEEEIALAKQIEKLQAKLAEVSQTRSHLQTEIAPWESFRKTKLAPMIEKSAAFAVVEEKLNKSVDLHFHNSSVDEMLALDDGSNEEPPRPPKISILFNCAGLSHQAIKNLSAVNGEEFAESEAGEMVNAYELSFGEKLKLKELKIMFWEDRVPAGIRDHEDKCALCSASTPKEVEYFLVEHEKEFDFDLLEKYEITGRMFLALTAQDIRKHFADSPISAKQLTSVLSYAKKQHHKD